MEFTRRRQRHWIIIIGLEISIIILVWKIQGVQGKAAKLVIYQGGRRHEVHARRCRAGIFLLEPMTITCACVTGVWGFYTKYCKEPYKIVGGNNYCFHLPPTMKFSQVILFGHQSYPLDSSLTHFREDYLMMTKSYVGNEDSIDLDASSSFLTVTATPWTITSNTGQKLCLKDSNSTEVDRKGKFCLFDFIHGGIDGWKEIYEIHRGCFSQNILHPSSCHKIHPTNDEAICTGETHDTTLMTTVESSMMTTNEPSESSSTVELSSISSLNPTTESITPSSSFTTSEMMTTTNTMTMTTEEESSSLSSTVATDLIPETTTKNVKYCPEILIRDDVKRHWKVNGSCSPTITEIRLTDQLKRFNVYRMNKILKTRQNSLVQIERLIQIQRDLLKVTCPPRTMSHAFTNVMAEGFFSIITDDFFYGVEEMEEELYGRVISALESCLKRAKEFIFIVEEGECNVTKITGWVIIKNISLPIIIEEGYKWKKFEPLIESGWKMFLNVYAYCYDDFLRQNDHHAYAVRMMQLFSNSVYEKWILPLEESLAKALYKFIVPCVEIMDLLMNNMDYCVGAVQYVSPMPVFLHRNVRDFERDFSSDLFKQRNKRSIWINYLQNNREDAVIWDGTAFCLREPQDPSFHLGQSRCAHP